ncbi:MAG: DapH/DapD/GlmU-related protein [Cyanobacteria bacterium J06621_11]
MDSQIQNRMLGKASQSTVKTRKRTRMLTLLCGWIPLSIGVRTRALMYRIMLRHLGRAVNIQTDVSISDGACIGISDHACINKGTILEAHNADRIHLDRHVFLDRDVRISCGQGGGLVELREHVSIDRGVDIKTHSHGHTLIGKHTYIGPYSCLSGYGDIKIGANCLIASHTSIYAHNYNFEDPTVIIRQQGYTHKGITIGDDCWIGSGVRIVDGVTIGTGSVIGAGAVVTKNIPPNSIAVGAPAKVIKTRSEQPISQHSFVEMTA